MANSRTARASGALGAALVPGSRLCNLVCAGLQALERINRKERKVVSEPPSFVTDSLALDEAYAQIEPREPRWDYLLGTLHREKPLIGVEVHGATPGEVMTLVEKKRWAESRLATELRRGARVGAWFWVTPSATKLSKNTREYRLMSKNGIILAGHCLPLPSRLDDDE